ncbi:DNA replication/repair protein RecF [Coxiella endosymbiont of Dermacentor marginatus]|uniref:DNA replication/repair protein RecF n=1 Tax=Coxiella endosymbiont of Dermacentor marginatus TaxID=1656159 RepID=UPI0022239FC0|nr:DNA replication/repair protein RecF [Coxiella endosymbiont of Dermacentor marginatus]
MPNIAFLKINQFRNLKEVVVSPASKFNFFFGSNGSGKTSLLESIYFLGMGRSFRTHLCQQLIQHTANHFSVFATIKEKEQFVPIGVERYQSGDHRLKLDGEVLSNWTSLAKQLPLCLLSAMNHRFLLDGPKIRRQFLDWLLFHAEPAFFPTWQRIQRLLKQRNAALKLQLPLDEITHWDQMLSEAAEHIHALRQNIISEFNIIFSQVLQHFLPNQMILTHYYRGWLEKKSLLEQLQSNLKQDLQYGYTRIGPQRADFRLLVHKLPAQDILSQGQQKLVTYALYLAQGLFLKDKTQTSPIYLIDDLTAELDTEKRYRVISLLTQLQSQVFITGTSSQEIKIPTNSAMFHVKHCTVHPSLF